MSSQADLKTLYPFLHGVARESEALGAALLHSVEEKARDSRLTSEIFFGAQATVLVADDNDVAQRLCQRVLEKAGFRVLIARDGLQAVEVALAQSPAMILMDVAMPGIDGIEAMRRIKAAKPGQTIVIASAHSMASDRERFLAAGADDVLSKPFRLADLVAIVQKLTARPLP